MSKEESFSDIVERLNENNPKNSSDQTAKESKEVSFRTEYVTKRANRDAPKFRSEDYPNLVIPQKTVKRDDL